METRGTEIKQSENTNPENKVALETDIAPEPDTVADGEKGIESNSSADPVTSLAPVEYQKEKTAKEISTQEEIIPTENVLRRHIKEDPRKKLLAKHRLWMDNLQHEYPMPYHPFKIGVYIRYYNQTRYKNYIEKHIQQFTDDIGLCKRWTLVDFYIDKGMTAPRMENSKEWCRLLGDCMSGKVDLIVTQKVSSVSSDADEMAFVARILAAQEPPVGIYFISEDIFTLASYYRADLLDRDMFLKDHKPLPLDELDAPMYYDGPRSEIFESITLPDTVKNRAIEGTVADTADAIVAVTDE